MQTAHFFETRMIRNENDDCHLFPGKRPWKLSAAVEEGSTRRMSVIGRVVETGRVSGVLACNPTIYMLKP